MRLPVLASIGSGLLLAALTTPPVLFAIFARNPDWADFWLAAAQPYATVLVGAGAILAAGIAFLNGDQERRQRDGHEALNAKRALKLQYDDRYSILLSQLSDPKPLVREGSAHELVALAEDWLQFGDEKKHRVCIATLASYLRIPMTDANRLGHDNVVRSTILRLLSQFATQRGIDAYRQELTLANADLRAISVAAINLRNFWLPGAKLADSDLSAANFTGANLTGAELSGCDLRATDFSRATLQLVKAHRTNLRRTNFTAALLSAADFTDAYIISSQPQSERASRRGADFLSQAPRFPGAYLMAANLTNADLSGAVLKDAHLEYANFSGATLHAADLTGAFTAKTDFAGADLTGATF